MKKSQLFISTLIIASILLAGCNQTPPAPPVAEKIRLVWWGTMHDAKVMQPLIDEYQSQNPNITIEYSTAHWNTTVPAETAAKQYQQDLNKTLKSNNIIAIPDIFNIDSTWTGEYAKYLSPAPTDIFTPDNYRSTFYPAVAKNFVYTDATTPDEVLGVPDYIDVLGLVYNNNLLVAKDPTLKIPTGWSDFRELAHSLTQQGAGSAITQAGFSGGYGANVEFSSDLFNLLMLQNDVKILDVNGVPAFATSDIRNSTAAFDFYKSFVGQQYQSWVPDASYFRNDSAAFIEQKLVSLVMPSWRYRQLLKLNQDNKLNIDMRVAKIPQLAGQNDDIYWATFFGNVVSKQRSNATAAWQFLSWLSKPEQLRKIHDNTQTQFGNFGTLYPRVDMQSELANDKYLATFNEMLPKATTWPMVDGVQARQIFEEILNNTNADSALHDAEARLRAIFDQKDQLVSGSSG